MKLCEHGKSGPHDDRVFNDPKDPLENREDGSGRPYLGDTSAWFCEGPTVEDEA